MVNISTPDQVSDQGQTARTAQSAPDSISGPNHPLAQPTAEASLKGAFEVVAGANGPEQKPLAKLTAGDHTVELGDGRQFLVHVPVTDGTTPLPAMFVFSGSAEPQWNIKDFAPESGMSGVADEDPKHPWVVVYPLAKEHKLGVYSAQPAYGYNTKGVLIDEQDRKNAGYDDIDYVKKIVDLMPKIADVDSTHKDWGAIAFSQGGVFLNKLVATVPDLFPSIGLVGTTMQKHYKYDVKPGNAKDVAIVELLGDRITLPIRKPGHQSLKYDEQLAERFALHDINIFNFHGKKVIEQTDPLAAIHNENQSPLLQNKVYKQLLGQSGKDYTVAETYLPTPVESKKEKDFQIDYTPTNPKDNRHLAVFGLVEAQHSYPAPLYGPRTNATTKYTQFDTSRKLTAMFNDYNDRVHQSALASKPDLTTR
jgi:poly(3-hydroxybutyrate) depolymerase